MSLRINKLSQNYLKYDKLIVKNLINYNYYNIQNSNKRFFSVSSYQLNEHHQTTSANTTNNDTNDIIKNLKFNSTTATTTHTSNIDQNSKLITTPSSDIIRKVFDDEQFWNEFNSEIFNSNKNVLNSFLSSSTSSSNDVKNIGLFQNPFLTTPEGLKEFSKESLNKAEKLVKHIIEDNSEQGYLNYIRNLDRLSDILCRVIDLCEFIRVVHPNKNFINAAQECHQEMFQYMNVLNTTRELYDKLNYILNTKSIKDKLTDEEKSVGELLFTDFKKSGIDMDEKTRNDFVELSQFIAISGQNFNDGLGDYENDYILINKNDYNENDIKSNELISKLIKKDFKGNLKIPLYGRLPYEILRSCPNSKIREKIWLSLHQTKNYQIEILENILKYRGVLAKVLGNNSFSEYQLTEKMAKTPENVMSFLSNLLKEITPDVLKELDILYKSQFNDSEKQLPEYKIEDLPSMIKPWDRDYLSNLYLINQRSNQLEDISNYFSIGIVIEGLSNIFKNIYGIEFKPVKAKFGEIWSNDVRKFEVISEDEGLIGIIYLDLFYRENKTLNPAHFTVCCSRKIYPEEEEIQSNDEFKLSKKTLLTNKSPITGELFQLPVISLVCNFQPESIKNSSNSTNTTTNIFNNLKNQVISNSNLNSKKTLLSLSQTETLFHEMGHALHSMLGRTNLHNVSGTRCSTDFVELPSILMEHFAKDPRVILSFARHYETNKPLPIKLLNKYQNDNDFLKNCETFGQIKMALLDQILHSNLVFDKKFNVIKIYHELENHLGIFADEKSNWPGKFGHLYSYGSVYYSYLFDRAIASKIYNYLFLKDPLNKQNGLKFKSQVLKWGGSKNPWELISNVLDKEELKKGDVNAMKFIAKDSNL
ncbi:hypothetical protein B5S29_g5087 [[Candida] boidinii]|nr:hypothetical protein B5S29_g5087 [[Candida] boidinii]